MAAITDLSTLTTIADGDYLVVSNSGTDKKITRANLLGSAAVTFTQAVTAVPASASVQGIKVEMPASNTGYPLWITQDGNNRLLHQSNDTANKLTLYSDDYGGNNGSGLMLGRDSNASQPSPAYVLMEPGNGTAYYLWVDNNGTFRIHTAQPTYSTENGGTVVGSQSSSLDAKNIVGDPLPIEAVQAAVKAGADAVRRFTYKSGAYNEQEFSGVVTDYAPRYGMDRDDAHPAGKSLNPITAIGDLLIVVANLSDRLAALEAAQNG